MISANALDPWLLDENSTDNTNKALEKEHPHSNSPWEEPDTPVIR